jgi:hypothetical protein
MLYICIYNSRALPIRPASHTRITRWGAKKPLRFISFFRFFRSFVSLSLRSHSQPQGDTSPQHDPGLYLSAAQGVLDSFWSWASARAAAGHAWPPLLVNTHGWVKGLGFDLLVQLLRLLGPTHVVQVMNNVVWYDWIASQQRKGRMSVCVVLCRF